LGQIAPATKKGIFRWSIPRQTPSNIGMRAEMLKERMLMIGVLLISCTFAQAEEMHVIHTVPFGLLRRVFEISYAGKAGTCFAVDVDGRQYVVTARHVVPNIKSNDVVRVYQTNGWQELVS
jgi:hypothetical protein